MNIVRGVRIGAVMLAVFGASFVGAAARADGKTRAWVAVMAGDNEVPPRDTHAHGTAVFHLREDGSIEYQLIVANIENVVASHIHLGPAGVNGPIVIFLFGPAAPGGGRTDGVIATGTLTAEGLIGPLAGHPLSDLIHAMDSGDAYVNVHTNDGVDGVDTGPGDFPGGEIRGQIMGGK
jgi:hypothetical protein